MKMILSTDPPSFVSNVQKVIEQYKAAMKEARGYQKQLIEVESKKILAENDQLYYEHVTDGNFGYLGKVANEVLESDPNFLVIYTIGKGQKSKFAVYGPSSVVDKGKKEFMALIEARGGGKGGRLQGSLT
eukprot:UN19040